LELEADAESLMLMAPAGYHPDFVPALHHLLEAQDPRPALISPYSMHPRWATRDRDPEPAYASARLEFDRRWPAWYASPGGNPPIVVFAGQPSVLTNHSHQREILVPMRCQNLAGAVEVVLRTRSPLHSLPLSIPSPSEFHQITGCTSDKTLVSFPVSQNVHESDLRKAGVDIYVTDDLGSVLARASVASTR
jgi:hypothetical protein